MDSTETINGDETEPTRQARRDRETSIGTNNEDRTGAQERTRLDSSRFKKTKEKPGE